METVDDEFTEAALAWLDKHAKAGKHVGQILKRLDDLGVAGNAIVVYTTDNGARSHELAGRRHDSVQG
jgi:arylsulfatase A-like enzyme